VGWKETVRSDVISLMERHRYVQEVLEYGLSRHVLESLNEGVRLTFNRDDCDPLPQCVGLSVVTGFDSA
jgi:hypothetical protein